MSTKVKVAFLFSVFACTQFTNSQIILEVPGYAVLNGTEEASTYTERVFYAFRSVFYADQPTSENRFLVIYAQNIVGKFVSDSIATATFTQRALPDGRDSTSNGE